jgi:hypothetical protein
VNKAVHLGAKISDAHALEVLTICSEIGIPVYKVTLAPNDFRIAAIGSPAARRLIVKALAHPHYRVRRAAIWALAPKADGDEKAALLDFVTDRSAPVRAALAVVIGQHRWTDGLDALLTLLGDRRNYARHFLHQHREEPEYHVARAAANAFGQLDSLPVAVLDRITAFLIREDDNAIDALLHGALLDLMITPDYPMAWKVIEHCLCDNNVVGSSEENLYPVRYVAAWIAVRRFSHHPSELNLVPWSVINRAVDHIDPQLAAPLLLVLGAKLARYCDADSLEALRGTNTSESRVALALSMLDDLGMARSLAIKHGLLAPSHPLFEDSDDLSTDDAQLSRWALSSSGRSWLSSMQGEADVDSTLLWMMTLRTGLPLIDDTFEPWSLRRKKVMPIMTFAEMLGEME